MPQLQKFDFRSSQYERPTRNWVCGYASVGNACRVGPDAKGNCCGGSECQPRREGDRWTCTRPASAGGACEAGPRSDGTCACLIPPCVPVRSLRGKRSLAVRWAVVAAIGFVAILIGSTGLSWMMPGSLNAAHASLENCQSCHTTVGKGSFGWVHAAFMPSDPAADSGQCLECHVAGERPMNAHGMSPTVLASLTEEISARFPKAQQTSSFDAVLFTNEHEAQDVQPCATCHTEHRGAKSLLTDIPETACQTCHVAQFASFSNGHPEFHKYPYSRRSRIIFDHESHFSRHFGEAAKDDALAAQTPGECVDCHTPAVDGRLMATMSFEETCSACHINEIRGLSRAVGPRGIAFLSIPGLDLQTLSERGVEIGSWPSYAEAPVTPFMNLLLSGDPAAAAALKALDVPDMLDLRDANEAQLKAIEGLAWGVKRLLRDLTEQGSEKLRERLVAATGERPDDDLLADLIASIPRAVLVAGRQEWMPNLEQELADRAAGKMKSDLRMPESGSSMPPVDGDMAGAPASKDTGDILGAASKDTGDILGAASKDTGDILGAASKDTGDILGAASKDTGDILGAASKDTGDILGAASKDTGDILGAASKDTGDILGAASKDTGDILGATSQDTGDILGAGAAKAGDALGALGSPAGAREPVEVTEVAAAPEPLSEEDFVRLGGWYRQNFSVLYLPDGHADNFFKAWLDYTADAFGTTGETAAAPVFTAMTDKDAQGACATCHSIDETAAGKVDVNWGPKESVIAGGFTRFTHEPHLQLSPESGCLTCHEVDRGAKFQASFADRDPDSFASNFTPVSRAVCADCHTETDAGDNCTQCHSYHATAITTPTMGTRVVDSIAERTEAAK